MPPTALSVVIPTHNTRELTLRCIESVCQCRPDEIIVVDDASEDGTREAIEARFQQVRTLTLSTSRGFGPAANRGLAAADGDILWLLNSDTEVHADAIRVIRSAMNGNTALGIVGARLRFPDGRAQWSGGSEPTLSWFFVLASGIARGLGRVPGYRRLRPVSGSEASPRAVEWVPGAALAMRRDVWESCGPLDESFEFYCQDLELCLRARDQGWQVSVLPELEVVHHQGATVRELALAGIDGTPEVLWMDLLCWAEKRRGADWAKRAKRRLRLGGRVRSVAYLAGELFTRGSRRALLARKRRTLERALDAVERWEDGPRCGRQDAAA